MWLAASVLLVVLIIGVGLVVAFALDQTSLVNATVGATMVVMCWHALRRLGPQPEEGFDDWPTALFVLGVLASIQVLVHWNPWLLGFAWLVFPLWLRVRRRS
jgi:hypothetical protein